MRPWVKALSGRAPPFARLHPTPPHHNHNNKTWTGVYSVALELHHLDLWEAFYTAPSYSQSLCFTLRLLMLFCILRSLLLLHCVWPVLGDLSVIASSTVRRHSTNIIRWVRRKSWFIQPFIISNHFK